MVRSLKQSFVRGQKPHRKGPFIERLSEPVTGKKRGEITLLFAVIDGPVVGSLHACVGSDAVRPALSRVS